MNKSKNRQRCCSVPLRAVALAPSAIVMNILIIIIIRRSITMKILLLLLLLLIIIMIIITIVMIIIMIIIMIMILSRCRPVPLRAVALPKYTKYNRNTNR